KEGARLGFVTPASWLTSDYAIALQKALLGTIRVKSIIGSIAESFFPQVDVNTVLIVAEKAAKDTPFDPIRFITLKKPILQLTAGTEEYWARVAALAQEIEVSCSVENDRYRAKLVDASDERKALNDDNTRPRNWSKYLRAPLSYYAIFEKAA